MSEDLVMEIKPKFNLFARIFSENLFIALFISYFVWYGLSFVFMSMLQNSTDKTGTWASLFWCSYLVIFLLLLFNNLLNYLATRYTVYNNRIDFEEGFIDHKNTTINLKDIREIHLTRSLIQRFFGLGTIRFVTAANTAESTSGVKFNDIQNSREVYEKVRELHENLKGDGYEK